MSTIQGSGGIAIPKRLHQILQKDGFLLLKEGGQEARNLYVNASLGLNPSLLNEFALVCLVGHIDEVTRLVESGEAPNLSGTETPFKTGYASLVCLGAQRVGSGPPGVRMDHAATLKFLLSHGCPPDVEDIVGHTALHHLTPRSFKPDLARILLENGANVNHQNRYGEVPIMHAMQAGIVEAIDLLMEFGADIDIPEADGITPRKFFVDYGPKVTATVTKWIRKRNGEEAPLGEKKCDNCGRSDVGLKQCSNCHSVRYCSSQCQRAQWKTHKPTCRPFDVTNTVSLRPIYDGHPFGMLIPTADLKRKAMGIDVQTPPARNGHHSQVPSSFPKSLTIKVQVPYGGPGMSTHNSKADLLIYNKKRDFVCTVQYATNPKAYTKISQVVRSKGVGGAKAYFVAELKSKDELIVKIDDVLAEQPF
ncbi:hypothetical protein K474DRAFT_1654087 [Panus rudis PR-1116 ss-1]|nr:hypothetical protein K474DRAFT_1654087 [Panus rudis PR-1116 ss-1]